MEQWLWRYEGEKIIKMQANLLSFQAHKADICQLVNCHFIDPLVSCKSRVDKTHRSSQSLES